MSCYLDIKTVSVRRVFTEKIYVSQIMRSIPYTIFFSLSLTLSVKIFPLGSCCVRRRLAPLKPYRFSDMLPVGHGGVRWGMWGSYALLILRRLLCCHSIDLYIVSSLFYILCLRLSYFRHCSAGQVPYKIKMLPSICGIKMWLQLIVNVIDSLLHNGFVRLIKCYIMLPAL